ncbi:MAG TPA: RNA polymerase sigma factor [Candidatus Binatia bacterium]|nr:RNA polymerase sigma factor [Candidatus Binatia bacterium]
MPVACDPSDAVLLRRTARGDEASFATLLRRYERRFYGVARRLLGDDRDAEDAVQLAFLRVFARAGEYRDGFAGATWLYRILTNVCIDAYRKRRAEARALGTRPLPASAPGPRAERVDLEAALARLPAEGRVVLLLRYVDDLPYREIARVRGITVNTVKTHLRRAKLLLRRHLEEPSR